MTTPNREQLYLAELCKSLRLFIEPAAYTPDWILTTNNELFQTTRRIDRSCKRLRFKDDRVRPYCLRTTAWGWKTDADRDERIGSSEYQIDHLEPKRFQFQEVGDVIDRFFEEVICLRLESGFQSEIIQDFGVAELIHDDEPESFVFRERKYKLCGFGTEVRSEADWVRHRKFRNDAIDSTLRNNRDYYLAVIDEWIAYLPFIDLVEEGIAEEADSISCPPLASSPTGQAEATRSNQGGTTSGDDRGGEPLPTIEEIEKKTPRLDPESIEWVAATKKNLKKLGLSVSTLRNYRLKANGGRPLDAYFGEDKDGRRWRRCTENNGRSRIFYFAHDLKKRNRKVSQ